MFSVLFGTTRRVTVIALILIAAGAAVSSYLLVRHFSLLSYSAHGGGDFCSALFGKGCDDALRSDGAIQLGVPLAGWGLVYYGSLLALLFMGWVLGEAFRFEARAAAFLISLVGAAGSIALFFAMVTDIAPFCPMCAVTHAINLLLLYPLKRLMGCSIGELVRSVFQAIRYLLGGKVLDPVQARWKIVGYFAALLVAVAIYQWAFVEYALHKRPAEAPLDPRQTMSLFMAGQPHEIPVSDTDPQLGPADAPVQMVVFYDFLCPGCKQLAKMIPVLASEFGDTLHVVFKNFPLDSVCNPLMKETLHPLACEAAWAAEAAKDQKKFWDYHDVLANQKPGAKESLQSLIKDLNLDIPQFDAYRHGQTASAKVQQDVALGISLGVDGTPSVFINGRRAYDTRAQALKYLIAHQGTPQDTMVSRNMQ